MTWRDWRKRLRFGAERCNQLRRGSGKSPAGHRQKAAGGRHRQRKPEVAWLATGGDLVIHAADALAVRGLVGFHLGFGRETEGGALVVDGNAAELGRLDARHVLFGLRICGRLLRGRRRLSGFCRRFLLGACRSGFRCSRLLLRRRLLWRCYGALVLFGGGLVRHQLGGGALGKCLRRRQNRRPSPKRSGSVWKSSTWKSSSPRGHHATPAHLPWRKRIVMPPYG